MKVCKNTAFLLFTGEMQRRSLEAYYDSDLVQKEEIKDMLDHGLHMIEKLKCWYSRKNSQCYYNSQVYIYLVYQKIYLYLYYIYYIYIIYHFLKRFEIIITKVLK